MSSGNRGDGDEPTLRDDILDWTFAALLAALVCGIVATRASVAPAPSRLGPVTPVAPMAPVPAVVR